MSGSGSGSRAISENPARNPVASARRKAVWSILAVSRRPIGANSLSGSAPRYSPDMTRLRCQPESRQVVQAERENLCTGERIDGRRDERLTTPGQELELYRFDGCSPDCRFWRVPLWRWPAGRQKGARAKAFGAQAYWFASGIRAEI